MRTPFLALTMLASGILGLGTASALTGEPDTGRPAPEAHDDARAGSDRVLARTPSPTGGPDYAVRSYGGQTGLRCIALGRTDGQRFGRAKGAGVAELALDDSGSCADPAASGVQLAVQYTPALDRRPASSALFGTVQRADVRALDIRDPTGQQVEVSPDGGVLSIFSSATPALPWVASVTHLDGRIERFEFDSR